MQSKLGNLIVTLSDQGVMEYVSEGHTLTIPLAELEAETRPLPSLEIQLDDTILHIALVYRNSESIRHLKNLLHPTQTNAQTAFTDSMRLLPVAFETRLSKRGFKETENLLVKKYVASRVDASILSLLIDETETIRTGGRRTVDGRSFYEAPATPLFYLLHRELKLDYAEFSQALADIKPIISLVSGVKTQREIIHSRLSKPVDQAKNYRTFIELINKARSLYVISAEERRSLEKKWREVPEERGPIEEDLRRRVEPT